MAEPGRTRTEASHLSVRLAAGVLVGIGMIILVVAVALRLFIHGLGGDVPPLGALPDQARGFPAPSLRTSPAGEPEELDREKRPLLDRWGWADRDHRLARIPLNQAVRLLESRGWPGEDGHGR